MSSDEIQNGNNEKNNYGVADAVVASPILTENEANAPFPLSSSFAGNNKKGRKHHLNGGNDEIQRAEQARRKQELTAMEKEQALNGGE